MTIDTRNKRASAIGRLGLGVVHPVPDGTLDALDRRHLLAYAGELLPPMPTTRNKRASAIGFSLTGRVFPTADGTISTADRRALLAYRLVEDAPVIVPPPVVVPPFFVTSPVSDLSSGAVSICSNALLMLGDQTINALLDDSDRARTVANLYLFVVGHVQSSHPWNCCRKRLKLNPDVAKPSFDYAYQFTLPGDFLRVVSVGELGQEFDYELEAGKILCDESVLPLRYIFLNRDESTWTKLLISAVTMAMRQVLAYPITQSTSLEALIDQAIEPMLQRARTIDSQDRPAQTLGDFRLANSRLWNGSGH